VNLKEKVLFGVFLISFNLAAWQKDGVPITTGPGDQVEPKVLAVSSGDFYVVWTDHNIPAQVFVRLFDKDGNPKWSSPVKACDSDSIQWQHSAVVTPSGSIIIAFVDERTGWLKDRVYVSKIGLSGNYEWPPGGIRVSIGEADQIHPHLCLDDSGEGCYVTWTDYRPGDFWVYLTKITKDGTVAFEMPVCSIPSPRWNPTVIPSGEGIIIFWGGKEYDTSGVYANKLLRNDFLWGERGKLILPYPSSMTQFNRHDQFIFPYVSADSSGGAYVFPADPYEKGVQRVDSLGNLIFDSIPKVQTPSGIAPTLDGVVGCHPYSGPPGDWGMYVDGVKVDSVGVLPWSNPSRIWTSPFIDTTYTHTPSSALTSDYSSGCIVAIGGEQTKLENDILVVRVDSLGEAREPLLVCGSSGEQQNPVIIHNPSTKGYFIVWEDHRGSDWDIYAICLDSLLRVGIDERKSIPAQIPISISPNPFNQITKIHYPIVVQGKVNLRIYDACGKKINNLVNRILQPGIYEEEWNGKDDGDNILPEGVYFCHLMVQSNKNVLQEVRKVILLKKGAR
jgi:hypothetical protein